MNYPGYANEGGRGIASSDGHCTCFNCSMSEVYIKKKNTPIVSGISHNISFRFVLFNSIK